MCFLVWACHKHHSQGTNATKSSLDKQSLAFTISFFWWPALCNPMISAIVSCISNIFLPILICQQPKMPDKLYPQGHMVQGDNGCKTIHHTSPGCSQQPQGILKHPTSSCQASMNCLADKFARIDITLDIKLQLVPSTQPTLMMSTVGNVIWLVFSFCKVDITGTLFFFYFILHCICTEWSPGFRTLHIIIPHLQKYDTWW